MLIVFLGCSPFFFCCSLPDEVRDVVDVEDLPGLPPLTTTELARESLVFAVEAAAGSAEGAVHPANVLGPTRVCKNGLPPSSIMRSRIHVFYVSSRTIDAHGSSRDLVHQAIRVLVPHHVHHFTVVVRQTKPLRHARTTDAPGWTWVPFRSASACAAAIVCAVRRRGFSLQGRPPSIRQTT